MEQLETRQTVKKQQDTGEVWKDGASHIIIVLAHAHGKHGVIFGLGDRAEPLDLIQR